MASPSPEEFLKTAEKRAATTGGFFSFGSSSNKLEEAAELFKAAANKFRLAHRFDEAGHAFMKAAETEINAGEKDYAANTFFEASKCFKMSRPEREYAPAFAPHPPGPARHGGLTGVLRLRQHIR